MSNADEVASTALTCAAKGRGCGTPSGWRAGGRCPHCRDAHNADLRRSRGLTPSQRRTVLRILRNGQSPADAAAAVGRTSGALSAAAVRDGELRMALDGFPEEHQLAARMGDYLAALTRTGGIKSKAIASIDVSQFTLWDWRNRSPAFAAAERATMAMIADVAVTPRRRTAISDAVLDRAAELLEKGSTVDGAAAVVGISPYTLRRRAQDHERLRVILETRPRIYRGGMPKKLTDDAAEQLRHLWPDTSLTIKDIAQKLQVSTPTVYSWKRRLGLPRRPRGGRRA